MEKKIENNYIIHCSLDQVGSLFMVLIIVLLPPVEELRRQNAQTAQIQKDKTTYSKSKYTKKIIQEIKLKKIIRETKLSVTFKHCCGLKTPRS